MSRQGPLFDHFAHIYHGDKLIGYQLGGHDTARLHRFAGRNTYQPGQGIEHITQYLLETDTEHHLKQIVDQGNQGDKANQHGRDYDGNGKTGNDIFPQHLEETDLALLFFIGSHQLVCGRIIHFIGVNNIEHHKGTEHIQY